MDHDNKCSLWELASYSSNEGSKLSASKSTDSRIVHRRTLLCCSKYVWASSFCSCLPSYPRSMLASAQVRRDQLVYDNQPQHSRYCMSLKPASTAALYHRGCPCFAQATSSPCNLPPRIWRARSMMCCSPHLVMQWPQQSTADSFRDPTRLKTILHNLSFQARTRTQSHVKPNRHSLATHRMRPHKPPMSFLMSCRSLLIIS